MKKYNTFTQHKNVSFIKKILFSIIPLYFVLFTQSVYAQTFVPVDKDSLIQSVNIDKNNAIIKMSDYTVSFPVHIMQGTDYNRATGITPKGMSIGLKYNANLLRLVVVDKAQKNYMVSDFVAENSNSADLKLPDNYKKPIDDKEIYVSSVQFIASYPFWTPNSTSRGFDLLVTKEKGIIGFFPAIQLELADKLCRADTVTSGIFELLPETQNINCDSLSVFDTKNYYKKLQTAATAERSLLIEVLECSQGGRQPKYCQKINQDLAQKALGNISIHSLLQNITGQ